MLVHSQFQVRFSFSLHTFPHLVIFSLTLFLDLSIHSQTGCIVAELPKAHEHHPFIESSRDASLNMKP
jgi:hypothetical protein